MLNLKSALTISSETVSGFGQIFQAVAYNFEDTVWNGRGLAPKIGRQVQNCAILRNIRQCVSKRKQYRRFRRHGIGRQPDFMRNKAFGNLLPQINVELLYCRSRIRPHQNLPAIAYGARNQAAGKGSLLGDVCIKSGFRHGVFFRLSNEFAVFRRPFWFLTISRHCPTPAAS